MMWTAKQTVQALRNERVTIRRRWQKSAQARLWHLDRAHFASDGVVMRSIDTIVDVMIAYFVTQILVDDPLASSEMCLEAAECPPIERELDATEPDTEPPGDRQESVSPSPTGGFRYAFNLAQPQTLQGAHRIAGLSLAWTDVRAALNLLATTIHETLTAYHADPTTLDLVDGYMEAIAALVSDLRVQQLEQELATYQEEAVATQHLAGRFLANASHELRTPLTAVLGFAELLAEENYGPLTPDQAVAVGHIENSAQNLLEIINNMLDLLHIRSGQLTLRYKQINLRALLESLYLILIPLAGRKSVQFEMERGADLGTMEADENIVRHIVYYLLSSALRATPTGGRVTLRAWRKAARVGIEVQDTALHLPPEAMENMGNPFPRLENSPTRGYEGWEVGLPLVHRYVDLHHGTLKVESLPAQGTVFRVELPLKRPAQEVK